MATSRRFQAEMETGVRQFGDEAVVPDFYTLLWVIRFGLPADLFSFFQIFKVAHYQRLRLTFPYPFCYSIGRGRRDDRHRENPAAQGRGR
jgi:hypothetical protein